jgi:serine protein kinase
MVKKNTSELHRHLVEVKEGKRCFENAFQGVARMILDSDIEKVVVNGKTTYDFSIFRTGKKHIIGMYDEINSFVSYVKDAAENGSSKEMAFVLVGEPGNGKTFLVDYVCNKYRDFLSQKTNRKYSFRFTGLDKIGGYGKITTIESQTYEDPMILGMNITDESDKNREFLSREIGFSDNEIETLWRDYRPLGACSAFIWDSIRNYTSGDLAQMLEFIQIIPVPMTESLGTVTGKYAAKDKITSSAVDLLGEESIQRLLHITETNNPYRFDLRRGALARVAGGGIHFSDEIFKNKKDLVQVYLGVIQNRNIEIDGYKWPIDTLIIATSNNSEFNRFLAEKEEAPIVDRCRICYVSHNTNYKLQKPADPLRHRQRDPHYPRPGISSPGPQPEPCRFRGGGAHPAGPVGKADPHRDHEAGCRRGGRRKEHQNPGRGHRYPQPGPGHHQAVRSEGAGAA